MTYFMCKYIHGKTLNTITYIATSCIGTVEYTYNTAVISSTIIRV